MTWDAVIEEHILKIKQLLSKGTVNPLALQSLLDGELLATVSAFELLLLRAWPLVQTLEVGGQNLLTGKTALTQQAGVVLLLYD